jgi:cell division protein FtsB
LGKVKDIWNGRHKGFVRYAAVITALALIYALFFSDDNLIRWFRAGIELRQQRRQIERYQKEIKSMDERIKTLSTDRDSLEQYARENFNFAEPGDDVYLVK